MIWVTADHHFGHRNIIPYCGRPFKTTDEMDYALIRHHNEMVKPEDVVYHLGDFTLYNNPFIYLDKMNGRFIFIKGNHDHNNFFNNMPKMVMLRKWGVDIWMTHDPNVYNTMNIDGVKLCGHIHEKWKQNDGRINVGVDVWDYRPVNLAHLIKGVIRC